MNPIIFLAFTLAFAFPGGGALSLTGKDALQYEWNPTITVFPKAIDSFELHRSEFKLFKYQDFDLRSVGRHAINRDDLNNEIIYHSLIGGGSRPDYSYDHENLQELILQYDGKHKIAGCYGGSVYCSVTTHFLEYDPLILGTLVPRDLANKWIEMKLLGVRSTNRVISFSGGSSSISMDVQCLKVSNDVGGLTRCENQNISVFKYKVPDAAEDYKRTAILVFRMKRLYINSAAGAGNHSISFNLIFQL